MVRALLLGKKTQTRRIMKVQPPKQEDFPYSPIGIGPAVADGVKMYSLNDYARLPKHPTKWDLDGAVGVARNAGFPMQYDARMAVGDRLWVKETWFAESWYDRHKAEDRPAVIAQIGQPKIWYDAGYLSGPFNARIMSTSPLDLDAQWSKGRKRVSIHMPRFASRLTLTVTDVRVERLNACSEADAIAEGIEGFACIGGNAWRDYGGGDGFNVRDPGKPAVRSYATLWNLINGAGAWAENPWVVATTFDVRQGNIDG